MTKKEIVKAISEQMNLTQLQTKEIVQKTFEAIVETLVTEGRIELRNFGVFEVKKRAARKARNPRTGDRVHVPEKFVVTFKPGKKMEEEVRKLETAAQEKAAQEASQANAAQEHTAAAPSTPSPPPATAPREDAGVQPTPTTSEPSPNTSDTSDLPRPDTTGPSPSGSTGP